MNTNTLSNPLIRINPNQFKLFGITVSNGSMKQAVNWIIHRAETKQITPIAFINADCLNKAWSDKIYRETLHNMSAVYLDGIGVKLAGRMRGIDIVDNVNGTDLFPQLCEQMARRGLSLYLLGGKKGVAHLCADNMQAKFPGLQIAGVQHGYFNESERNAVIADINNSGADVLVVAFGAPLQEQWIKYHEQQLAPSVRIGVGGCLDFYSGRISRSPKWMRQIGMEWVWRLLQEPGRMWKRYILGNPLFLFRAWLTANIEVQS
jgi:N-acetylglucosaminyldiphosphoundecaprenol N-acetyl-beta-D-mannosaminyltransferase